MSKKDNFQHYCEGRKKAGDSCASSLLKNGHNALTLALNECYKRIKLYESQGKCKDASRLAGLVQKAEEKGLQDGSFEITYENSERIYNNLKEIVGKDEKGDYHLEIISSLDPVSDHDLIATWLFCNPKIRKRVGDKIENLYRVVLTVGTAERKGYLPKGEKKSRPARGDLLSKSLEKLIAGLPRSQTEEDKEYQRVLKFIINKKAEREVFSEFQSNPEHAFKLLNTKITSEDNEELLEAYNKLKKVYTEYQNIETIEVNPNFQDHETGKTGVLPSLHQKIALYHYLEEKRFGIFDGCGTGKTAVPIIAKPLIEKQLEKPIRTLIVGPNSSKKAWKAGLIGKDNERYLVNKQNIMVIGGGVKKTPELIESLKDKEWVIMNHEQLLTNVNGNDKLFIDYLAEIGFDQLVFDEFHHLKGLADKTKNGGLTQGAAARKLAKNVKYLALLTGTPIPNNYKKDYAVAFSLLNPKECPDPDEFAKMHDNNPRILYTFLNNKTIRRTFRDINNSLEWEEKEELVELDEIQRKIYQHITKTKPKNWLPQARKALLDPRLVDPEILQEIGLIGKVNVQNSAKYNELEDILISDKGPLQKAEKFVIFSSMFREGVTQRHHQKIKRKYKSLGLSEEYEKLGLDKSISDYLCQAVESRIGRKIKIGTIDGTVKDVEERERIIDGLNHDLDGLVCTTGAGGESLNMQAANWGIFLDDDYIPLTEEQATTRILRKGQKRKVMFIYLRGKNTLDEKLRDYVKKKVILNEIATDGHPLTKEEQALLEDTHGKKLAELIQQEINEGGKQDGK